MIVGGLYTLKTHIERGGVEKHSATMHVVGTEAATYVAELIHQK